MATVTKNCECCGRSMQVRSADLARGWGRFCSKTCKAREQEKRTGQYRALTSGPRHDGLTEMKHKVCAECGRPAINGVYGLDGGVQWYCAHHMVEAQTHPFTEEALQP